MKLGHFCQRARTLNYIEAAPFTVWSTPDFESTNGMEQNTIT